MGTRAKKQIRIKHIADYYSSICKINATGVGKKTLLRLILALFMPFIYLKVMGHKNQPVMQQINLHTEISSLQNQLDLLNKKFEDALEQDVKFIDAKKLFNEIRILQDRIDELHKNNPTAQ